MRLFSLIFVLQVFGAAWAADPILYFHPIRTAYGLSSENDIPTDGVVPQNNTFYWVKLGLKFPLHGNKAFLFTPRWIYRQFDQSALEYWNDVKTYRRNECEGEGIAAESCARYTDVANGTSTANNVNLFELGWEMRWYQDRGYQGYFQKVVGITGLGYYESDVSGLIDGAVRVRKDNSYAAVGALMYGIGWESVGDFISFTFDSAIGLQLAGPFPEYLNNRQRPLEQDLFRAEFDIAIGFEL